MSEPANRGGGRPRKPISPRAFFAGATVLLLAFGAFFTYLKLTGRAHGRMATPAGWMDIGLNGAGAVACLFAAWKCPGRPPTG
jgi:hypothetical protein